MTILQQYGDTLSYCRDNSLYQHAMFCLWLRSEMYRNSFTLRTLSILWTNYHVCFYFRSEKSGDTLSNSQDTFTNFMDKSPTSASMCGQQEDSGDEHDQVDTNDKEYYDRLMVRHVIYYSEP